MRKWSRFVAWSLILSIYTTTCFGCDKFVQGVVVEAEETDEQKENDSNVHNMTIREMTDAPERYEANVTVDGNIHIKADAAVEIPDVDQLHLKRGKPVQRGFDYYLNLVNGLADEKISKEDLVIYDYDWHGSFTIENVPYSFTYIPQSGRSNLEEFMIDLDYEDGLDIDEKGIYMESGEYLFENHPIRQSEYLSQTEMFLNKIGFSDFRPVSVLLETYDSEKGEMEDRYSTAMDIGDAAQINCERITDGIPVNWIDPNTLDLYFDSTFWPQEVLQVSYYNEVLISFSYCYPMESSGYSDENQFLLPFHEIRGIFEEMLGMRIYTLLKNGESSDTQRLLPMRRLEQPYDSLDVNVTRVQLGYMRIRDEETADPEELNGILIPVWDFGGTWIVKEALDDGTESEIRIEDRSLLTLDARDGGVITRMFGY